MKENEELIHSAIKGVSYLISVQLISRLFSFLMNIGLTRYMNDPAPIGISSVQLWLLYTLTLTLSRESNRRIAMRISQNIFDLKSLIFFTWLGIFSGIFFWLPIFYFIFLYYPDQNVLQSISLKDYEQSLMIVSISIIIELLSEPMFIVSQNMLLYGLRSSIEASSVLLRCVITFICVVFLDLKLQAFAYGMLSYSICLFICYLFYFVFFQTKIMINEFLFHFKQYSFIFNKKKNDNNEPFYLIWSVWKNQIWKLILAEGENIIMMTIRTNASEQGLYSIISNLGSLIVRFVFLPIEETSYTVFGRIKNDDVEQEISRKNVFIILVKTMSFIGLLFICFGSQYTHLLLSILYGSSWLSQSNIASNILSWYCLYVGLIAINGILESFLQAVASNKEMDIFNYWLFFCSIIFWIFSAGLNEFWGSKALIFGNCINASLRIVYNLQFSNRKLNIINKKTKNPFLSLPVLLTFIGSFIITYYSNIFIYDSKNPFSKFTIFHLCIGFLCFLLIIINVYIFEYNTLLMLYKIIITKKNN